VQDSISFTPIILDEKTRITADYKPQDMLDISNIGVNASKDTYLDYDAALALLNMQQALLDSDINVQVTSAYRSFQSQIYTYDFYVTNRGEEFAKKQVAPPGHSEHQLGLAVDLVNEETNYRLPSEGQTTQLYDWLIENASDYGFYQTFDQSQTEYREEIWHWRYIDD
jgi:D-alanyl-D-alanine carboxypeptidase